MTTAVRPEIDQQTREELQPPCEVAWILMLGGVQLGVVNRCDRPAEWIVYRRCHCGASASQLICTPCLEDPELAGARCLHCGCIDKLVEIRTEPLR